MGFNESDNLNGKYSQLTYGATTLSRMNSLDT